MKKNQYKRLFSLLVGPLLAAGMVSSYIFYSHEKYVWVLCEKSFEAGTCKFSTSPDDPMYKSIYSRQEAWFSVSLPRVKKNDNLSIQVSRRFAFADEITEAIFHDGPDRKKAFYMSQMIGRKATLLLGAKNDESFFLTSQAVLMACHTLDMNIKKEPKIYSAECFGHDWRGLVKFKASDETEKMFRSLQKTYHQTLKDI